MDKKVIWLLKFNVLAFHEKEHAFAFDENKLTNEVDPTYKVISSLIINDFKEKNTG